jgi:peptide/nickel transport system substrate-binding protein/oligopeptide transport system substrate-binding protein
VGWISSDLWVDGPLDPAAEADELTNDLYGGLVKLDSQYRVVPDLAQALPEVSADHLTYTFTLRPGLRFSDGTPLTAQDVIYSISRALSKAEQSAPATSFLGHIKGAASWTAGKAPSLAGVTAPDARTVRITLDAPISYFLAALATPTAYVVKKGLPPGINLAAPHAQALTIASGPFMFGKPWRYRQELYLIPNPFWYGAARLHLKELRYRFYADPPQQFRGYQSGQIDVSFVPASLLPAYRHDPNVHSALALQTDYLVPNLGADALCKPAHCTPFNDLHFRRALLYAIDRRVITQTFWNGKEMPLCGLIPRGILGYDPSLCSLTPYDPVRARAELALAKKDFGGTIPNEGSSTLVYLAGFPAYGQEAVALQEMWARVGLHVSIDAVPGNVYESLYTRNTTPFFAAVWGADYADPQDFAENLLTRGSAFDIGNYDNPTYAHLVQLADTTVDPRERERIYVQAQRLALADVAFVPIGQKVNFVIWPPSVHGDFVDGAYPDYTIASVG